MNKNKWIEAKVKAFNEEFPLPRFLALSGGAGVKHDLMISFLRQSLEECWSKAQDDYHELEIITEHRSLDEALKPEHIDIKPLLDCKPEKTLLIQYESRPSRSLEKECNCVYPNAVMYHKGKCKYIEV